LNIISVLLYIFFVYVDIFLVGIDASCMFWYLVKSSFFLF
jgi:hypothetical protein